jgi:hypothetical protein
VVVGVGGGETEEMGALVVVVRGVYVPLGNDAFRPTDPRSKGKVDGHLWLANFSARSVIGQFSKEAKISV